MTDLKEKALKSGLLDPEVHGRLIADIEHIAKAAGIPMHLIWSSAAEHCEEEDLEFTRKLPQHAEGNVYGLMYTGRKHSKPVHMRMMALAGACIRNFINAKVMTLQDVLLACKKDAMPKPTVLFIPNFFLSKEQGGAIPSWQVSSLLGMLLARQSEDLITYVYVEDPKEMGVQYGDVFLQHFSTYFTRCD